MIWLNCKLCVKRKLSHSDENAYVFLCSNRNIKNCDRATKLDALGNFVPLYFSLRLWFTFQSPLFPGAIVELENSVFQQLLKIIIRTTNISSGYLNQRKET